MVLANCTVVLILYIVLTFGYALYVMYCLHVGTVVERLIPLRNIRNVNNSNDNCNDNNNNSSSSSSNNAVGCSSNNSGGSNDGNGGSGTCHVVRTKETKGVCEENTSFVTCDSDTSVPEVLHVVVPLASVAHGTTSPEVTNNVGRRSRTAVVSVASESTVPSLPLLPPAQSSSSLLSSSRIPLHSRQTNDETAATTGSTVGVATTLAAVTSVVGDTTKRRLLDDNNDAVIAATTVKNNQERQQWRQRRRQRPIVIGSLHAASFLITNAVHLVHGLRLQQWDFHTQYQLLNIRNFHIDVKLLLLMTTDFTTHDPDNKSLQEVPTTTTMTTTTLSLSSQYPTVATVNRCYGVGEKECDIVDYDGERVFTIQENSMKKGKVKMTKQKVKLRQSSFDSGDENASKQDEKEMQVQLKNWYFSRMQHQRRQQRTLTFRCCPRVIVDTSNSNSNSNSNSDSGGDSRSSTAVTADASSTFAVDKEFPPVIRSNTFNKNCTFVTTGNTEIVEFIVIPTLLANGLTTEFNFLDLLDILHDLSLSTGDKNDIESNAIHVWIGTIDISDCRNMSKLLTIPTSTGNMDVLFEDSVFMAFNEYIHDMRYAPLLRLHRMINVTDINGKDGGNVVAAVTTDNDDNKNTSNEYESEGSAEVTAVTGDSIAPMVMWKTHLSFNSCVRTIPIAVDEI